MRRQQRYRSRKEWKEIIADWKRSGLTGPEFSLRHGLNYRSLYRWSTKLFSWKQRQESVASKSSLEVQAPTENALEAQPSFRIVPVPAHLAPPLAGSSMPRKLPSLSVVIGRRFRVVVPDGFSPATLGKLIQTLEALR